MVSGCGEHGHHAQQHVELALEPDQQTLAMVRPTLGCHAVEVGQILKPVKVKMKKS